MVYSLYIARKELDRLDSAVKCINISDVNIEKIFEILRNNTMYKFILCITGIQLSAHRYYLDRVLIIHCH